MRRAFSEPPVAFQSGPTGGALNQSSGSHMRNIGEVLSNSGVVQSSGTQFYRPTIDIINNINSWDPSRERPQAWPTTERLPTPAHSTQQQRAPNSSHSFEESGTGPVSTHTSSYSNRVAFRIHGLPFGMTEDMLLSFISRYGGVSRARVFSSSSGHLALVYLNFALTT